MLADAGGFKKKFKERFLSLYGKDFTQGSPIQHFMTLASMVRDEISRNLHETGQIYGRSREKKMYYFSIEFLPGRFLMTYLHYLGVKETVEKGLAELGISLDIIKDQEQDPGLGNGGLGRLASAFLDSLASLGMPGFGCGIRYRYGLFEQKIVNKEQVELPDNWLQDGCPWEYRRPEEAETVKFGGHVSIHFHNGKPFFIHENYESIRAVPYDIPILGYRNNAANVLRIWSAEAENIDFEFHTFSRGEYARAFADKIYAESISQVLYPDDSTFEGRKLRLKQSYFFVSAGLQSIVRQFKKEKGRMKNFHEKIAVHINDTHPAVAVAELMRILLDEEGMEWDEAWLITTRTISYTNHTLLPEALERWPVDLFRELLPRIYMIVEEINNRLCREVTNKAERPLEILRDVAIIGDGCIKMANLAIVGSHSVNGVARLHTQILKNRVMNSFNELYPGKFNNKTNGITHRRWLLVTNPWLNEFLLETIGTGWLNDPNELEKLAAFVDEPAAQEGIERVKLRNKERLARFIQEKYGVTVDPHSIFDIHIKRIHMYKRQLLNAFHILDLYNRLREKPDLDIVPRTFIFGGKAAPAYFLAKRVIKLINTMADLINHDQRIKEKIKIVFLENYNVSLAELAFPAADVSEQISTASREASGTGNMKFMMNGAVTIGTMDGANIEIMERVGPDNFIVFGLTAEEVLNYYAFGGYSAWEIYCEDTRVKKICDQLVNGFLPGGFQAIFDYLFHHNDEFFVLKDFASYVDAQNRLMEKFKDKQNWSRMRLQNIAHSGFFSSDRTISEYAQEIWKIKPVMAKKAFNPLKK
ncbi:MAG: glycogen/starch/alpha-glucan phosphorylase [Peptococcaceae bacterium]|jgi:starch phosphorylase|nr:glycogen/starch/alpha-glucan phosphorylase [Peptococcaceae bacterium]MDH7524693.1 glycogen/starch/alpha-glucan phosphorylase [Peptococcaceae bacterium]